MPFSTDKTRCRWTGAPRVALVLGCRWTGELPPALDLELAQSLSTTRPTPTRSSAPPLTPTPGRALSPPRTPTPITPPAPKAFPFPTPSPTSITTIPNRQCTISAETLRTSPSSTPDPSTATLLRLEPATSEDRVILEARRLRTRKPFVQRPSSVPRIKEGRADGARAFLIDSASRKIGPTLGKDWRRERGRERSRVA
jgi:hypothetical protein